MDKAKKSGQDVFRDSPLRYLGYANEIGEAFRPLVPLSVVRASYLVATGYVVADVYDKASKVNPRGGSHKRAIITAGDVFIWQMFASVIIPGFTINRITHYTAILLQNTKANRSIRRTVPTIVGLCAIPLIINPIDRLVDILMDGTYRKWF